jgi:hypothetical protein
MSRRSPPRCLLLGAAWLPLLGCPSAGVPADDVLLADDFEDGIADWNAWGRRGEVRRPRRGWSAYSFEVDVNVRRRIRDPLVAGLNLLAAWLIGWVFFLFQ